MSEELVYPFTGPLLTGLQSAKAYYDAEADELDLLLPGSASRGGSAVLIGNYYVRVDVETGRPLSVIIYDPHAWLEQKLQQVHASFDQAAQLRAGLEQFLVEAARPDGYQLSPRAQQSRHGAMAGEQATDHELPAIGQAILATISQVPVAAVE